MGGRYAARLTARARRHSARLAAWAVLLLALFAASAPLASATTLADPASGVAIFGYDPVAYRVEGAARAGLPSVSVESGGLTWRFVSEANREAFLDDPASYAPRFGGYDGAGLARGFVAAGDPELFAVIADGLCLFRSEENRASFVADSAMQRRAASGWAALKGRVLP